MAFANKHTCTLAWIRLCEVFGRAAVVILHALFDLKAGVAEADFRKSLEDFCAHLQQSGDLLGWRWMRQIVPPGPSFPRPTQAQFVAFE